MYFKNIAISVMYHILIVYIEYMFMVARQGLKNNSHYQWSAQWYDEFRREFPTSPRKVPIYCAKGFGQLLNVPSMKCYLIVEALVFNEQKIRIREPASEQSSYNEKLSTSCRHSNIACVEGNIKCRPASSRSTMASLYSWSILSTLDDNILFYLIDTYVLSVFVNNVLEKKHTNNWT